MFIKSSTEYHVVRALCQLYYICVQAPSNLLRSLQQHHKLQPKQQQIPQQLLPRQQQLKRQQHQPE